MGPPPFPAEKQRTMPASWAEMTMVWSARLSMLMFKLPFTTKRRSGWLRAKAVMYWSASMKLVTRSKPSILRGMDAAPGPPAGDPHPVPGGRRRQASDCGPVTAGVRRHPGRLDGEVPVLFPPRKELGLQVGVRQVHPRVDDHDDHVGPSGGD